MPPFQYEPFHDPYVASIGDLLLRPGEIAARRAEITGAAVANAARDIGQTVAGAIDRQTDPARKVALLRLAQEQRAAAGQSQMAGLMKGTEDAGPQAPGQAPTVSNPYLKKEGDVSVWDVEGLSKAMAAQGYGDLTPGVVKDVGALNSAHREESAARASFAQAQTNVLAKGAGAALSILRDHPDADPTIVIDLIGQQMAANGTFPPEKVAQVKQQLLSDPTQLAAKLEGLAKLTSEKPVTIAKDAMLKSPVDLSGPPLATNVDPNEGSYTINGQRFSRNGTPIGSVQPIQTPPKSLQSKSVLVDGKPAEVSYNPADGSYQIAGQPIDASRVKPIPPASMTINPALVPTGDALDMAARKYLATGELPSMGMGMAGVAARVAVMNKAAAIDPQASLAANRAVYKADSSNLTKLQTTEGTLSAFENAAGKNIQQFIDLTSKLPDTGVPWANTPIRLLNEKLVGAEWMPAVTAARKIALREVGRVTNDPGLKGQLTDSARNEVESMISGDATIAQMKRTFPVLLKDMANVHAGLNQQIDTVKQGLGANPAAPATKSGTIRARDPQGVLHEAPAGTALPAGWKLEG